MMTSRLIQPAPGTDWSLRSAGLIIEASSNPDSQVFASFFAGYDRAFILPDEKEDREGFRACMVLNQGSAYERIFARFGPFREVVLVARDGASGTQIGGANFISFPLPDRSAGAEDPTLSTNLNYIYIDAAWRRHGYFRRLIAAVDDVARRLFESASVQMSTLRHLIFFEQNDPFRLSADNYARDTGHSGLDQFARVGIWAKLGAQIVDFPYVQPALSADQDPDDALAYGILGAANTTISACALHDHLERFFGISVFKGKPMQDTVTLGQLGQLRQGCERGLSIALLDMKNFPTKNEGRSSSLRESLRAFLNRG